jgi:predicted MFS family arabinose efflux permease
LILSSGIALGALAGVAGGKLPAVMHSTRNALLLAAVVAPLAVLPILGVRLGPAGEQVGRAFTFNPFVLRFLTAVALWSTATGAFNPFFNVFFARELRLGTESIGLIFSAAQLTQVGAVLLAPLALRRFGLLSGIMLMQVATGCALALLGSAPAAMAGWLYAAYMSFQYMSEPGIYTLLMNRTSPAERQGAASLNIAVVFGSQALAASLAGAGITHFGYPPVLFAAAVMAVLAAVFFRTLLCGPSK